MTYVVEKLKKLKRVGLILVISALPVLISCGGVSKTRVCKGSDQACNKKGNSGEIVAEADAGDDGKGTTAQNSNDQVSTQDPKEISLTKCSNLIHTTFKEKVFGSILEFKCFACHNEYDSTASNTRFIIKEGDEFLIENFYMVKSLLEETQSGSTMPYLLEKATGGKDHVGGITIVQDDTNFKAINSMKEEIATTGCPADSKEIVELNK